MKRSFRREQHGEGRFKAGKLQNRCSFEGVAPEVVE